MRALFGIFALLAGSAAAHAQSFSNSTIVWTFNGKSAQIFVAKSGNVYSSFNSPRNGIRYALNRNLNYGLSAAGEHCDYHTSAAQSASTLTLDMSMACTGSTTVDSTQHIVATVSGTSCQVRVTLGGSAISPASFSSETCTVTQGNQLAQ